MSRCQSLGSVWVGTLDGSNDHFLTEQLLPLAPSTLYFPHLTSSITQVVTVGAKCICLNCTIYLSQQRNVFVYSPVRATNRRVLTFSANQMVTCLCQSPLSWLFTFVTKPTIRACLATICQAGVREVLSGNNSHKTTSGKDLTHFLAFSLCIIVHYFSAVNLPVAPVELVSISIYLLETDPTT